jgi:hypothetical protein
MVLNKQITVQIKGVQDGLLISLADGEWEEQLDALMTYIHEREGFFKRCVINYQMKALFFGQLLGNQA